MSKHWLTYTGRVENGALKIVHRGDFDRDMANYEGQRVVLQFRKYQKTRSNKQNAYYHGCVIPFVIQGLIDVGFERRLMSPENVHHMLREKFLRQDVGVADGEHAGEFITLVKSTTELTTTEFMDYIADIQKWAAEFLNIYIPDPGEQSSLNL